MKHLFTLAAIAAVASSIYMVHTICLENGRMHAERIAAEASARGYQDFLREQREREEMENIVFLSRVR